MDALRQDGKVVPEVLDKWEGFKRKGVVFGDGSALGLRSGS